MADTEEAPIATSTDKASSTSSTPTVTSAAGEEQAIRELGEQILAEIDATRTNDTLTRWLAHHIAGLITRADAAASHEEADAGELAHEARTAIFQLWQHRSAWPDGWPPPRAAEMTRLLDSLPPIGEGAWFGRSLLGQLHNLHLLTLATIVDLVAVSIESLEADWLQKFGEHLTDDEVAMLRRAAETDMRFAHWVAKVQDAPDDQRHPLTQLTDQYQQVVRALVDRARRDEQPPYPSE